MNKLNIYLILKLKSYHPHYLNKFLTFVSKKFQGYLSVMDKHVFLPKHIERFTVLRSPHVHKKARDQFERQIHQRLLCWVIPYSTQGKNFYFLFLRIFRIFSTLAIGVEFRITHILKYSDKFKKKNKKKNLNAIKN